MEQPEEDVRRPIPPHVKGNTHKVIIQPAIHSHSHSHTVYLPIIIGIILQDESRFLTRRLDSGQSLAPT